MMASPHAVVRSSLEEMLDSLRRRDEGEKPRDLPPALPSRPTSKARLPKRLIQAKLAMQHVVSNDSRNYNNNNNFNNRKVVRQDTVSDDSSYNEKKHVMQHAVSLDSSINHKLVMDHDVKCVSGCNFGRKKMKGLVDGGESPYTRMEENGDATLATPPEVESNDCIGYFIKNKLGVWCKQRNDQWELAKIRSTVGEEAFVMLLDGTITPIPAQELLPANTEILDGVDDLVELSYLNEPSVLHNLQYRYTRDVIYSKAGPVLLAINPFKDVDIFGNDFVTAYREKFLDNPHVYATADAVYSDMMKDGGNQSIIISGESGSGKTETAKFAMQYLASVGGGNRKMISKLIHISCILEAFGNAKTSKNCNSSRFGKVVDIHYNTEGAISGACIQTHLLEKSRASQICRGQRSYHIFYQLCAGAPSSLKDPLNLKTSSEYKFLNKSGCLKINDVDDAHNFIMLTDALDTLEISHQDQENVFELLAAILWLGNISFAVINERVEIKADEASKTAARLLGCNMDDLILVLTTNRTIDRTEPLTLQKATDKRDALAQYIYESLFSWLVGEINRSLEGDKQHTLRTISIIDTCGFESFQKNSFQQLFINYADERLQQHFIRHFCKLEQEEYELDGIHWKKVEFEDNQECLDLFEKKPMGLLSILDEDSNSSKATDATFTNKIKQHLSSNIHLSGEEGAFKIHHYAGEVHYDASRFLEQNSDSLQSDIIQLFSSSCKELMKRFASGVVNQFPITDMPVSDSHEQSVASKFKDLLFKLIQKLENSKSHFIRCIRPNTKQLPGTYEKDIILRQLRCSRIMEIVQIAKFGYPVRFTHQEFANRFGCLLSENIICMDPLSISNAILQQHRVPPQTYQVGYTKLFFKGQVDVLENLRKQVLEGTHEVKNGFLGGRIVLAFHELKFGIVTLQSFVRGENARRKYDFRKKPNHVPAPSLSDEHSAKIIQIQSVVRGENARRMYDVRKKPNHVLEPSSSDGHLTTIVQIQSVVRGWLARRYFNHLQRWKKSAIDSSTRRRRSHSRNLEVKGLSQENIQIPPQNIEELQRRVVKAESSLKERDHENTALREQVRQFEKRWSEYESKMKVVEEMWQSQMASLQTSLAAAKKTLSSGISDGLNGRPDASLSPSYYDSEDNISGIQTPVQITPARIGTNRRESNAVVSDSIVNLSNEFELRKQNFDSDAKAIVVVNPGRPPSSKQVEDYKTLKKNFEMWKKDYKHRLRDAKTTLVKGVHVETGGGGGDGGGRSSGGDRRSRHWWGKLSKRGKDRIV